jgi:hypothetical protein
MMALTSLKLTFVIQILKNRDEERYLPSADVDEMMFASAGGGAVWAEEMF